MQKKFDKVLVLSTNQTCWEKSPPKGQYSELIEFGVCLLDVKTGDISDPKRYLVRPKNSEISTYCTALTKITPLILEKEGMDFRQAYDKFVKDYDPANFSWATYDFVSKRKFEETCKYYDLKFPMKGMYFCIKSYLPLVHRLENEMELNEAADFLGFEFKGIPHRAIDDAYNGAKTMSHLLWA
jgi:inhibitor of KinA sporulation pathway (predicted exonuclease)